VMYHIFAAPDVPHILAAAVMYHIFWQQL
jgi:hypothetical protein